MTDGLRLTFDHAHLIPDYHDGRLEPCIRCVQENERAEWLQAENEALRVAIAEATRLNALNQSGIQRLRDALKGRCQGCEDAPIGQHTGPLRGGERTCSTCY